MADVRQDRVRAAQLTIAPAVLLVAHGSAEPLAAATTRALAAAVAAAGVGPTVRVAYLDHSWPRPEAALAGLAAEGYPAAVVVPLLLTAAYHHRVDLPAMLERAREAGLRLPVRVTEVLGPAAGVVPRPLMAGLRRRLEQAVGGGGGRYPDVGGTASPYDAVVLAAAGTRDLTAHAPVDQVAAGLAVALGVPTVAGFASGTGPTPAQAVARLRSEGADRVAVAAYFLATGRLYRAAADAARRAGATAVARPLAAAPELVALICSRLAASASVPPYLDQRISLACGPSRASGRLSQPLWA